MFFNRIAAVVAVVATLSSDVGLSCTIVAVGKDASSTGSPLVSHTDDSGADTTDIRFTRVPRKTWPAGSKRQLYNWVDGYPRIVASALSPEYAPVHGQNRSVPIGEIDQVPETWAYWDMDYGVQNEWGLSIGESTATGRTVGWPVGKPGGYNKVGIEDLSKLAMERCKTADCAVELMGKVAEEQGFYSADSGTVEEPAYAGSSEALAVADTEELWVFNVMTGANNASSIWAAQRIPPNHVVAVGNTFTIRMMNLSDHENFRYSPNVADLAEKNGWRVPKDGRDRFDFFASYGYTPLPKPNDTDVQYRTFRDTLSFYSGRRMWRIFSLLSPEEGAKLDPNKGNLPITEDAYPGSVPAQFGSVSPKMVMNVLRDHYEGTQYDLTKGMSAGPFGNPNRGAKSPPGYEGVWERAISMHRTSWSYVLEPKVDGFSIAWFGYDAPHGTAYLPFFGAAAEPAPPSFRSHEGYQSKFNHKVAYWAFNLVNQYTEINFQKINKDVREKSAQIEEEGRRRVHDCISRAKEHEDQKHSKEVLSRCSNSFVNEKVNEWWSFAYSLFGKFSRSVITHNESANGEELVTYPEWWISSPEVGYTTWTPNGPFYGMQESIKDIKPVAAVQAPIVSCIGSISLAAFTFFLGIVVHRAVAHRAPEGGYIKMSTN